jgi:hypothetical protein
LIKVPNLAARQPLRRRAVHTTTGRKSPSRPRRATSQRLEADSIRGIDFALYMTVLVAKILLDFVYVSVNNQGGSCVKIVCLSWVGIRRYCVSGRNSPLHSVCKRLYLVH